MAQPGSAAFSTRQLKSLVAIVEESETNGIPVIGLVVNNPKRQAVDVTLIGTYGDSVGRTTLDFDPDDPARN